MVIRRVGSALLAGLVLLVCASAGRTEDDAPSIDALVDRVRNGPPVQFEEALDALAAMGAKAAPAVPRLIDNLDPPDDARRLRLSKTLVAIGEPAVPALVGGLMSWSGHTRMWCRRTLGRMGEVAAPAVPALAESLAGAHPLVQVEILKALGGIGEAASGALPAVVARLETPDADVRMEAVRTLGRLGPVAASRLVALAAGDDEAVAAEARRILGRTEPSAGAPDAHVLEGLATRLRKGSETVRLDAARAIFALGPRAGALVPALEAALDDESVDVRRVVVGALGEIGPAAGGALDRLLAVLDEDPELRGTVLAVLPSLGPEAERAVPNVARWLAGGAALRFQAAYTLARLGPAGISALEGAALSLSFRVRESAVTALAEADVADERLRPVFVRALGDRASSVRYTACVALGGLGVEAKPALDALRARLDDEAEGVRVAAARAMFAAGERGAELAPGLIEGLTSRTITLFEGMDDRLVALGHTAVPALTDGMRRMQATWLAEVCARIGKPAIPALVRGLENPRPASRRAALEALRAVGADGDFLLAPIAACLRDEDSTVRTASAHALVPFATTCPDALAQRVLPDLMSFFDRALKNSREAEAVQALLVEIGAPALPGLRARLEDVENETIRDLVRRIEEHAE